jgi:hypothetical protein
VIETDIPTSSTAPDAAGDGRRRLQPGIPRAEGVVSFRATPDALITVVNRAV